MNRKKSNSLQLSGSFLFQSSFHSQQEARQHPYRATQMWHRSIEIFLTGVPLGAHRSKTRFWKTYDNSFTGTDAINWFSEKLCLEFDPGITKLQGKLLLNKFFKAGVFKSAEESETSNGERDVEEFREGGIYRLTTERKSENPSNQNTPSKMKKNYSIEIKPLSKEEIDLVHFNKLSEKLTTLVDEITRILQPSPNPALNLSLSPSAQQNSLPTWLVSAMKCLTDFPKKTEIHCQYPNFNNDVYKLIVDYFQAYSSRVGLLIENTLFFKSIFLKLNNFSPSPPKKNKFEERFPFPKSEFEEIDRIFTPKKANSNYYSEAQPQRERLDKFVFGRRRQLDYSLCSFNSLNNDLDHDQNQSQQSLLDLDTTTSSSQIQPMGIYDSNRYKTGIYFETGFVNSSPITRVVSQRDLRDLRCYSYENPSLSLSPADLINHPKYSSIRGRITIKKSKSHADLLGEQPQEGNQNHNPPPLIIKNTNLIHAVALFLLTLEPTKRRHLEILLRFMHKISKNVFLCLDVAMRNGDMMLNTFAPLISHDNVNAVKFLTENVESIFTGEFVEDFKSEVEEHLKMLQIKKIPIKENKENQSTMNNNYCSKISMVEYENQRLLGETAKSLRDLLDAMCAVKDDKIKKKQLKKFEKEYPHIYAEKFNSMPMSIPKTQPQPQQQQQSQITQNNSNSTKRTPFGVLI